jgi:hypothetical protein
VRETVRETALDGDGTVFCPAALVSIARVVVEIYNTRHLAAFNGGDYGWPKLPNVRPGAETNL